MIGINLANSSDTSKFLPDGVEPRPGGYVMRPTNRLLLFALIILFLCTTVPTVYAVEPTAVDFTNAFSATCDDPPMSYTGAITSPTQVDYYAVDLVAGQVLTIDVDAEKIGSSLDSILEVFDSDGSSIGESDDSNDVQEGSKPGISVDPYLEITVPSDSDVTYYIAISAAGAVTSNVGDDDGDDDVSSTGPYTLLLKCSDQPAPSEFTWPVVVGDLLGATDSNTGSLINITPANAESTLPFDLGVGPIIDIEFDPSRELIFAAVDTFVAVDDTVAVDAAVAVDYIPAKIVALDPDSGNEVTSYSLETELVVALEAAEKELYGIQVDPASEEHSLVLVTFDDTALTATLTPVFSFGKQQVPALAYHQSERVMYAANGIDLLKIDLTSPPVGMQKLVKLTDLSFEIASMDFSHDDVLYVVDIQGTLYEVTDLTTGKVTLINPISVTSEVSGLTFVVGESPGVDPIKTICSSTLTSPMTASTEAANRKLSKFKLKNRMRRAIGLFKFKARAGENITIHLAPEVEESAEAGEKSTLSTMEQLWPRWRWRGKGRVFLGVRDSIPGVDLRVRKKNTLPMELEVMNLPATGSYYIMVIRPLFRLHKADYCLTLESDDPESQAWQTLQVAWPDEEDKRTKRTRKKKKRRTRTKRTTNTMRGALPLD
jgi:hypothetical protein